MNGKAEYKYSTQIIEGAAGPISESHLTILLELEALEPENPGLLFPQLFILSYFVIPFCDRVSRLVGNKIYREM
jgi:hypothetical protein